MKKNFFLIILVALFSVFVIAGNDNNQIGKEIKNTEWKLLSEKNGVQIYFKYENCNDEVNDIHQENVVLKVVNTTNQNITIEWDTELWYNDNCRTCNMKNGENHNKIQLNAGETKIGSCEKRHQLRELVIFSKFTKYENKVNLTKFQLNNIVVNIRN